MVNVTDPHLELRKNGQDQSESEEEADKVNWMTPEELFQMRMEILPQLL